MKRWLLLLCLVACKEPAREAEPHDHEGEEHADETPAAPGVVKIAHEMLRDLRVTTAKAETRAAGERVSALGELGVDEDHYAEIAAPAPARVVKVLVALGDTVRADQPLVELHSPELARARAEVAAARARAEAAERTLARKRALADEKLASASELADAESAHASAQGDLKVAQAALRAFGPVGEGERFFLRAPHTGTVLRREVVTGQLADPSRTLFAVGDLGKLWLTAHVFERDAVRIMAGAKATASFAALPGRSFEASLLLVGQVVDPASRTIPVRLAVANEGGILRPGMSATVSLPLGDAAGTVVAVPLAAVQRVGGHWVVFLPRAEGVFEIRQVGRGRELGGEVEIVSGLGAAEVVVVDGAFLLKAEADKARGEGGGHDHH
jgi:cobalt-zinc-cadmium efflux system membrane fusion protein